MPETNTPEPTSSRASRYESDPTYRNQQRKRSRKAYNDKAKTDLFDVNAALASFDDCGETRLTYLADGQEERMWVFTKQEVADLLGVSVKGFYLWVNDGRFPKPVITATTFPIERDYKEKKSVKVSAVVEVYSQQEVKAALNVLGPHLGDVRYYRKDHHKERRALYAAVRAARSALGLNELVVGDIDPEHI